MLLVSSSFTSAAPINAADRLTNRPSSRGTRAKRGGERKHGGGGFRAGKRKRRTAGRTDVQVMEKERQEEPERDRERNR